MQNEALGMVGAELTRPLDPTDIIQLEPTGGDGLQVYVKWDEQKALKCLVSLTGLDPSDAVFDNLLHVAAGTYVSKKALKEMAEKVLEKAAKKMAEKAATAAAGGAAGIVILVAEWSYCYFK